VEPKVEGGNTWKEGKGEEPKKNSRVFFQLKDLYPDFIFGTKTISRDNLLPRCGCSLGMEGPQVKDRSTAGTLMYVLLLEGRRRKGGEGGRRREEGGGGREEVGGRR
jgi:hypothetical protein